MSQKNYTDESALPLFTKKIMKKLVPEIRQEFEHPRKLHQEFLELAQGAHPFPPFAHDLQRLQAEQASNQGSGGRQADGRLEIVRVKSLILLYHILLLPTKFGKATDAMNR